MAAEKPKATTVKLGAARDANGKGKPVRFSHLHVHRPHLNTQSKKREYSTQLWIPKTNTEDKAALDAAVAEQLAHYKKIDGEPGKDFHHPIKDGDKLTDRKGKPKPVPGHWVVSAKTLVDNKDGTENEPPDVVGTAKDETGRFVRLGERDIKSGDWGRVSVNLKFFTEGDGGIGVYLNNIQKTRTGEALGGRRSADDEFGDYDEDDEEDPLG